MAPVVAVMTAGGVILDPERVWEIIRDVAGADFSGDPCDLTEDQRVEVNEQIFAEFNAELDFDDLCDRENDGGGFIDIVKIIQDVAGEDFDGDICSLTDEQRAEIEKRIKEELGEDVDFRLPSCDGTGGGHDGGGNGEDIGRRIGEIIRDVAGEDFDGNICALTEEQREEIERRVREELGEEGKDFDFDLDCDGGGHGGGHDGNPWERVEEIILEVAGEDFSGNPCDLTEEQPR